MSKFFKQSLIITGTFIYSIVLCSELQYAHKGYFDLGTIHRLSNGSIIKIPYRMITFEPTFTSGDINLIGSTAIEFRLKDINNIFRSDLKLDLRELYLEWMLPIGEFSFGKQIINWGAASENNPTDNLSPYNYYYLFSLGKERKEGIVSFNSIIYFWDLKFNALFIPRHSASILPLNDPEFAISNPIVPTDDQIMRLNNPNEYGISLNIPFNSLDLSTSYFSGYDRIVSFFGVNIWTEPNENPQSIIAIDTVLSYRKTDVYGLGFSYFLGDITIRADFGYFNTFSNIAKGDSALYRFYAPDTLISHCEEKNESIINDPFSKGTPFPNCNLFPTFNNTELINNNAEYYEYIFEIEYSPSYDINIISQYTKYQLNTIGLADSIRTSDTTVVFDPANYFIPGMGFPNTFISTNAISISAQKLFSDLGLELRYTSLIDLEDKGSLHEVGMEYAIDENTKLLVAVNKIIADKSIEMNPFVGMEDFSHIRFELKYYY